MNEDELNQVYYEINVLRARVQELERQANALQGMVIGSEATTQAISSIGKDSIFQLGAGAMTRANPVGPILVEVGAGIVVEKKPEEAKKILQARSVQAQAVLQQVQRGISEALSRIRDLGEIAEGIRK